MARLSETERLMLEAACKALGNGAVKVAASLSGLQLAAALTGGNLAAGAVTMARGYLRDRAPFVPFGDIARDRCHEQCQYASRYVDGRLDYPCLGQGLRFFGVTTDYHELLIHRDDVEEFVRRFLEYRRSIGAIA